MMCIEEIPKQSKKGQIDADYKQEGIEVIDITVVENGEDKLAASKSIGNQKP